MIIHIPLYILLFIYLAVNIIFALFIVINVGHILATGSYTITALLFSVFIFAAILIIWATTIALLHGVNWSTTIKIFDSGWFTGAYLP